MHGCLVDWKVWGVGISQWPGQTGKEAAKQQTSATLAAGGVELSAYDGSQTPISA